MRLDKYLAETAQCTRSEAKALLAKGLLSKCEYGFKVLGNGKVTKKVKQFMTCWFVFACERGLVDKTEFCHMFVRSMHEVSDMVKLLLRKR